MFKLKVLTAALLNCGLNIGICGLKLGTLKSIITVKEFGDLPEVLQAEYVKGEGEDADKYVLDTDNKAKIGEFRNNNIKLTKEMDKLKKEMEKFKDVDPTKYTEAMKKLQEIEDAKLIDAGKLEELLEQKTERMRTSYEERLKKANDSLEAATKKSLTLTGQLSEVKIDKEVSSAVSKVGNIKKGAMEDILSRARRVWKLDDSGNPVPMKGEDVIYGSDGQKVLTMDEWASGLATEAPYLFEESAGAGAKGADQIKSGKIATIAKGDKKAFGDNLEDIAKGKVKVAM